MKIVKSLYERAKIFKKSQFQIIVKHYEFRDFQKYMENSRVDIRDTYRLGCITDVWRIEIIKCKERMF